MKGRQEHIVPLSIQALELLEQARAVTGDGRYVFPSIRSNQSPCRKPPSMLRCDGSALTATK